MKKLDPHTMPLPFNGFIEYIRQEGFVIGVDHYLRLQAVLKNFGSTCQPSELKFLLCPIFATTQREQAQFYRSFDHYFSAFVTSEKTEEKPEQIVREEQEEPLTESVTVRTWPFIVAGILIMIVVSLSAWYLTRIHVQEKKIIDIKVEPPTKDIKRQPDITVTINLKEVKRKELQPELTLYQKYGLTFRWAMMFLPIVIFIIYEQYRSKRRKLVIEKQSLKKPPFLWPIVVDTPRPDFIKTPKFYRAAAAMRRRTESDVLTLDIDRIITETISHLGFPQFYYRALTRPPEYLILIDLSEPGDHYAYFMDALTGVLKNEGIHTNWFFYRQDPQVCFRSPTSERVYLCDIKEKYRYHRLIIVGGADTLLDPLTGELAPWTDIFQMWEERAILTTREPGQWAMKEVALAQEFIVLPASLSGLNVLIEHLEDPSVQNLRAWSDKDNRLSALSLDDLDDPQKLRDYLGDENTFQWLCSCAVYPEINWSFTLYLASLLDEEITEKKLLKLISLPWFRQGALPDELRHKLISELDTEKLTKIRQVIYDVLEKNPPSKESAAWDSYRLNLAVHKWMLSGKRRKQLKELQKEIMYCDEDQIVQDYTLVSILDSEPLTLLSFVLPKRFWKIFFRKGLSFFGAQSWIKAIPYLFISIILFFIIPEPKIPPPQDINKVIPEITLEFAHIPAGSFMMGSPEDEPGRVDDELQHKVTLTQEDLYMQKTEVTQRQWEAVMGGNPSNFNKCGDNCPVENVSWNDAQEFIKELNQIEGSNKYRLPTEAEWEYAARARTRTSTPFAFGKCLSTNQANYNGNYPLDGCPKGEYRQKTIPVGSLDHNAWGLNDMHGNVWEWCEDWYDKYPPGELADPTGPKKGSGRVIRGGSWDDVAHGCRSASRFRIAPDDRGNGLGFRLLRSYP